METTYQKLYSEKLRDERWIALKEQILQRDRKTCRLCADQTSQLHVHHDHYNRDPWDIPHALLRTVCCHCHEALHTFPKEILKVRKQFVGNGLIKLFAFTSRGVRLMLSEPGKELRTCYTLSYEAVDILFTNKPV